MKEVRYERPGDTDGPDLELRLGLTGRQDEGERASVSW